MTTYHPGSQLHLFRGKQMVDLPGDLVDNFDPISSPSLIGLLLPNTNIWILTSFVQSHLEMCIQFMSTIKRCAKRIECPSELWTLCIISLMIPIMSVASWNANKFFHIILVVSFYFFEIPFMKCLFMGWEANFCLIFFYFEVTQ